MDEPFGKHDGAKRKDLRHQSDKGKEPDQALAQLPDRNEELADDKDCRFTALEMYKDIETGFNDQGPRSDASRDNWDMYNCVLNGRQFYNGNSRIFVPLVHDAINARVTRFTNQIFPQAGRYVEVTTEDGELPHALMSLLDFYVERSKLRTEVIPALLRNGDCEGQYTIYVDWEKITRHVVWRGSTDAQPPGHDLPNPIFKVEDIQEDEIACEGPDVEVIADADFLVLPATEKNLEKALQNGGSVTVIRRWGKAKIQQMIDDGHLDKKAGKKLLKEMTAPQQAGDPGRRDPAKTMLDAAGIKGDGRGKFCLVYETWAVLSLKEGRRLCKIYYGGRDRILSIRRNPFWSDRLPIISCPIRKAAGCFKGDPPVSAVDTFQLQANDACNEGMDSAAYALLPIVMTDPAKNPRVGSMIMTLSAIWETSPNDTQFANFPPLWKDALEIVAKAGDQVNKTLGVNPAAITQLGAKKKLNQAEIAQEQQVDILTTADAVTVLEKGILTPFLERCIELDHQFREEDVTVRAFGEMGVRARMEKSPPIQMHKRWQFRWFGVEQARSAQMIQQQISMLNVVRGIPPEMYAGYKIDIVPAMIAIMENTFGPRVAPLIFKSQKSQFADDPQSENQYLFEGLDLPAHDLDNHQQHMMVHAQALQHGDPHGSIRQHMMQHQMIMMKAQMQQQQQQLGGPGGQGGPQKKGPQQGGGRGGAPSNTAPGGQPSGQMPGGQNPPGSIHIDQLMGAHAPRR